MTSRRPLAAVLPALLLSGVALAQKGSYREEFAVCTGFASSPIYPGCVATDTGSNPTTVTASVPPVTGVTLRSQPNGPYRAIFASPLPISGSATVTWQAPFDTQTRVATVTIRNAGTAALDVTAAAISSRDVTLTSPAVPFSVAAGAEQTLSLRFAPLLAGTLAGTLTLTSNDPDETTFVVPFSGTATATGTTPPSCTFAVSPAKLAVGAAGGTGSVNVASQAGCAWNAASAAPFATLGSTSGTGSGSVTVNVTANGTGSVRSGRLTVADLPVDVRQEAEDAAVTTVPIVLTSAGVNSSFFTSELTLTNRGQSSAVAKLTYSAAFGGGSGTGTDVLPAGAQLTFPDALSYLRSVGVPIPAEGNRGGTLRIELSGLTTPSAGSAVVRTASVVSEGRAGLAYGAVPRGAALTGAAYPCGLRQNATDRSNVAALHAGKAGEVERIGGTAPYYAYAVINDQANSDGSFVPPVTADSLAGKKGITLPVAVEVSTFSTELIVTNFGAAARTFQVTFVADAIQTAGNASTVSFTLAPGEQQILPDFVDVLRARGAAGVGPRGPSSTTAARRGSGAETGPS